MNITLAIQRYNPETDEKPYFKNYDIEAKPEDRLLDALMYVKTFIDGTLALRKSCAHGVCGSDAMIINDVERLACKTLIKDVISEDNKVIKIEPLKSLPLQRDLMVNFDKFFENYKIVKPFLINLNAVPEKERIQ
ncbi:MAG: succinate dehydrogenase iron-sulfur subunit, partial [Spirochaetales bacterium]